jgi:ribosomal protein L11 methyltransferase
MDGDRVIDYILEIVFDPSDRDLDEAVQSRLFVSASTGSTSSDQGPETVLSAYFNSAADREEAASMMLDLSVEVRQLERERVDWLEMYEQSLEPLVIGERFLVVPDARLIPADSNRLTIIVPQELAFGTGSHETTSLCIELLEGIITSAANEISLAEAYATVEVAVPQADRLALDIGTGSGILAIAMHRLGVAKVIAFDNDLDAYGPLRDNRIRNNVDETAIPIFIGGVEALGRGTFDLVTMNIIPEVILPLLPAVVRLVAAGGTLILSGILNVRRDDVVSAVEALGFAVWAEKSRGEWWAGALTRQ